MEKYQVKLTEDNYEKLAKKDILINTVLYPMIVKALEDRSYNAWKNIERGIDKYRDRNSYQLSSPYITKNMPFLESDYDLVFDNLKISKDFVNSLIPYVKLPPGIASKPNFTAFRTVMFLMMKYFMLNKKDKEMRTCLSYLTYSMYHSIYTKYWSDYKIREDIMKAMLNNMTMKFIMREAGSMELTFYKTAEGLIDKYVARIKRCDDSDVWKLCDDFKTRLNNQMHKIKLAYIKTNQANQSIGESIEEDDEGNTIETKGMSNDVENLSSQCQRIFFRGINHNALNLSADMCQIPRTELRGSIEHILMERETKSVLKFYAALMILYLKATNSSASSVEEIRSIKLAPFMLDVYKKGNSKDVNIIYIKKQMNTWLEIGCMKYKGLSSDSTKNNYRRAIFLYFVLCISMS